MDSDEYQRLALRSAPPGHTEQERLLNAALGLCGEAGEWADTLKKHAFHGHPIDRAALSKELGDILWYVALACDALDLQMSAVMAENIAKLRARYPDGFSPERSLHRVE